MSETVLFQLRLARYTNAGGGAPRVLSFRGVEAVNALYRFDVRVAVPNADAASFAAAAPEASVALALRSDAGTRLVHGIVGALTTRDVVTGSHAVFDLRIVPRLARLRHTRRSRIFQDLSTPEILALVLNERGIRHRWRLQRAYEKRVYTTQYAESDLAFVQRLAAEDGIFSFFDHPNEPGPDDATGFGDAEVLVFADTADAASPIDGVPSLHHRASDAGGVTAAGMTREEHHVHDFTTRVALRTKGVLLRSYSHESPLLESRELASPQIVSASTSREPRDLGRIHVAQGLTTYEHLGAREETHLIPEPASIALEQARMGAARGEGRSACRRIMPGRTFRLVDHEVASLNAEYTITRVEHRGHAPEVAMPTAKSSALYENRFRVVPRAVAARPRRPSTRARASLETAIVVGPTGQEVHTDDLGRVKVQFHWDLEGQRDDRSSCWLRVSQAWAGAGFGAQFIPRVGMEVLVSFVGGDPDRPVVTGCLYNAINRPAFSLRDSVAESGLRTRSLNGKGTEGSELVFDDSPGQERVKLASEGLLDIGAAREARVRAGAVLELSAGGPRRDDIARSFETNVGDAWALHVKGDAREAVGGHGARRIDGDMLTSIGGNAESTINGRETKYVSRSSTLSIGSGRDAFGAVDSAGQLSARALGSCEVVSSDTIHLRVGDKSSIRIERERIVLRAPQLVIEAPRASVTHPEGKAGVSFGPDLAIAADTISLTSSGASLVLDSEAKLDGALVKLNCGAAASFASSVSDVDGDGTAVFSLEPLPPDLEAQPVVLGIRLPTGEVEEHSVDAAGQVTLRGKPGDRFVLVSARRGDAPVALTEIERRPKGER